ncbi:ATP-dependent DNA helicase Q1-like [Perca fluviatilis]|uniref:ATP-dependent DNA helicase Q1-like n=1 Tax=Perca fluviatilis TaxID=8168 RepID=UPI001964F2AF|nr:ATP-dependent DNA helicase Q1-like [Perca fluviatilis]
MATAVEHLEHHSFESAIASVLSDLNVSFLLKTEQRTTLEAFISKKDVFAVFPTGIGKSLIYKLAPLVAKQMGLSETPLVVVISPLVALMEDQVKEATKLGLSALQLGTDNGELIRTSRCQLIFGSPESWLLSTKWREMLCSKVFRDNHVGIVVDEVHLTYKWGKAAKGEKAFRESFARLRDTQIYCKTRDTCVGIDHIC